MTIDGRKSEIEYLKAGVSGSRLGPQLVLYADDILEDIKSHILYAETAEILLLETW